LARAERDQGCLSEAQHTHPSLVFLGDSCTEFGTWPQLTLSRLTTEEPELANGVKLAVGGWSSEQGLRQFRRDVLPLHPHVVTIYFGWNDHWMAFGQPDASVHANRVSYWLAQHSRLAQLVVKGRLGSQTLTSGASSYRVPLDQYRANLEAIGQLARDAGIRAVFITAPTSDERGHEPEYLARRHLKHLEDLVPLHESYVQATREAAAHMNEEVCDAAAEFPKLPGPISQYFNKDGIHFSDRGSQALARMVTSCLESPHLAARAHSSS
jgi:lysophospholipase L1-like esterase